jgi:hypothetical protein
MKKYLFIFVAVSLANYLNAQKNFGIMAGSGFSNRIIRNVPEMVQSIIPDEYETFYSFYAGLYVDFSISDHFRLSPELFFSRRGRKLDFDPIQTTISIISNDLVLPVMMKFTFLKRFQVYTGPEFSYVLSRDSKGVKFSSSSKSKTEKSFDIALSAGGSIRIIKNLYIDLRYNLGLIDQAKTYTVPGEIIDPSLTGQSIAVDYDSFNRSFQIGLKYILVIRN